MASKTAIVNRALRRLGGDRLTNVETDLSEPARVMNDIFQDVVDEILAEHPWNCALHRTTLAADAEPPAWGFQNAFTLPADPFCLRAWRLDEDHHGPRPKWKVVGRKIHTDEPAPLYVELIVRVTDTELFPAYLATAISARLAAEAAYRLTNSREKEEQEEKRAKEKLALARSADAQEGAADEVDEGEFIASRV